MKQKPEPREQKESEVAGSVESVIANHPFLRGLQAAYVRLLCDCAMRVEYRAGEFIFREGDPANRFYLIEGGQVALESRGQGTTRAVRIQVIGPGEVLGWSWLFPPYVWNFDARALEPTTAIFFYGTRVREHCEENPGFGYEMMKRVTQVVIQRLQAARKQLLGIASGPA